ncbi:MAG: putative sulfate exporter family transporter [Pseudomonadota bacterium]
MEAKKYRISEDWLALWVGLFLFFLSLGGFAGIDTLGWGITTKVWTDPSRALSPVSKNYAAIKGEIVKIEGQKLTIKKPDGKLETIVAGQDPKNLNVGDFYVKKGVPGIVSLALTYLAMLIIMGIGARLLGADVVKFAVGFTIIFGISYACWLLGHYAHIAATKNELAKHNISWALSLTGEAGFIVALIAGLAIGNFLPGFSKILEEAARPELYIKTAIVILGAGLGVKAANSFSLATNVMFRGLCAIVEAYLIYWAVVYFVARKYFKFSREWAAPLASGISICGVSAAIATGGAIRARPIVPIMVSSLVVIFAVVEMLILPFIAQAWLWSEPMVAGAWMALAVKTDGGAVASGAIADALIRAKAFTMEGVKYQEGWITMTATTVKMFIDVFIGIWAFVLAVIWCTKIECKPGERVRVIEIWHRFPKFVIGYVLTFFLMLLICLPAAKSVGNMEKEIKNLDQASLSKADVQSGKENLARQLEKPKAIMATAEAAASEGNVFRVLFFVFTFFTIGLVSNFKKLWEEGIGRLAAVYVICLFGFIVWVGLFISWLFFHGVKPPIAGA